MVKKLTAPERRKVIGRLSSERVTRVSYRKGHLSLKFDGRRLRNRVDVRHDPGLGNWSRKHGVIYYDERIKQPDIMPVLIHEAVEKYAAQKYGLHVQSEAHKIAMVAEKRFIGEECCRQFKERCTHSGRCWRVHQMRLQGAWLAENANAWLRRRRGKKK